MSDGAGHELTDHPHISIHFDSEGNPSFWNSKLNRYLAQNSSKEYKMISFGGKARLVHRVIAAELIPNPCGLRVVDHINRDKGDNRIINLRWSSDSHNAHNSGKYKGFSLNKSGTFEAAIRVDGKAIMLGKFETEKEAHEAYLGASNKYFPGVLAEAKDKRTINKPTDRRRGVKDNTKGYNVTRNGKYAAYHFVNRVKVHIGTFDTELEARDAYLNRV